MFRFFLIEGFAWWVLYNSVHDIGYILNSSFLVLIQKMEVATNIKDFKHNSLVGSLYKVIAKVLARRMAKMIDKVVGEYQHAFMEGRQIHNAALVTNEVVDKLYFWNREDVHVQVEYGENLQSSKLEFS